MDADMLAWCEARGLTVLGKMSEGYDGTTCHPLHGRHYHCANCGEVSSSQGHMMGSPAAFTCQRAAPPHKPSSMCVDTCDNPHVCKDLYDAWIAASTTREEQG